MDVLALYVITRTLHARTLQEEELSVSNKALSCYLPLPLTPFSLPQIPLCLGRQARVCTWLAMSASTGLQPSLLLKETLFGDETPRQYYFSVKVGKQTGVILSGLGMTACFSH